MKETSLGTGGTSVLIILLRSISSSSMWYTFPEGVWVFLNGSWDEPAKPQSGSSFLAASAYETSSVVSRLRLACRANLSDS